MKKFIISSTVLAAALKKLSYAIHKNGQLPALGHVLVRASAGQAIFTTSDTEITIHHKLECECKEEFEFLVPFEFLNKIVAFNKACPLVFELKKSLTITDETTPYVLKSPMKIEDFPKLQELPKKKAFTINRDILHTLNIALATAGMNPKRPETDFVLMQVKDQKITVASSDNVSVVFSKAFDTEATEPEDLLLSNKIIKVLDGNDTADVFIQKKVIGFVAGDITIVNTRTEMKYGDFRKIFPADWPANLTINRRDLLEALGKCSISADPGCTTHVDLSADEVKLLADDGIYKINPSVKCVYGGEIKNTIVNSDKLTKLLHQVSCSEVSFAIHDSNRQIVISADGDPGYLAMIMPIAQMKK